jgi:hypothetical protein
MRASLTYVGQFTDVELSPRAVCDGYQTEELAAHPALPRLVGVDAEHRQDASEVDTHVVEARRDQGGVVLPRLTWHEPLPRPLSELPDEPGAERPVAGPTYHTHEPQVSLRGVGKSGEVRLRDRRHVDWTCRKVQAVDTVLEPAAHASAKSPLPEVHWAAEFRAASGDLPDDLGRAPDSARCLIPRSIPPAMAKSVGIMVANTSQSAIEVRVRPRTRSSRP